MPKAILRCFLEVRIREERSKYESQGQSHKIEEGDGVSRLGIGSPWTLTKVRDTTRASVQEVSQLTV